MNSLQRNSALAWSVFILLLGSSVYAQDTKYGFGDFCVHLNGGEDVAHVGVWNTLEIHFENDALLIGMSPGIEISTSCAFNWDMSYGSHPPVNEEGRAIDAWDFGTGLIIAHDFDDASPEHIDFSGAIFTGGGLPVGPSDLCYSLRFYIPSGESPDPSGICIQPYFYPPGMSWTFIDDGGGYPPDFCGEPVPSESDPVAGPVCFAIAPNIPPEITNCPASTLYGGYCDVISYQFEASDVEGDPYVFELVAGPGAVDPAGFWSFVPTVYDLGMHVVEIRACDEFGCGPICLFEFEITNEAPVFTVGCGEVLYGRPGQLIYHQLTADDPDYCAPLVFTLEDAVPQPSGPATMTGVGEFHFQPEPDDTGTFMFVVRVYDEVGEYDECMFEVVVLGGALTIDEVIDSAYVYLDGRELIVNGWYTTNSEGKLVSDIWDFIADQPMPPKSVLHVYGVPLPEDHFACNVSLTGHVDSVVIDPYPYYPEEDTTVVYFEITSYESLEDCPLESILIRSQEEDRLPGIRESRLDTCWATGDVDSDGVPLTLADLALLMWYLNTGNIPPPHPWYEGDLNGDYYIDWDDVLVFWDYIQIGLPAFDPYGGYPVMTCCSYTDPCKFAVLISGGVNAANNHDRYWNTLADYYEYLVDSAYYDPDNIFFMYFQGDSEDTVIVPDERVITCCNDSIDQAFDDIESTIFTACQNRKTTLFLVTYNHGRTNGDICLLGRSVLTPQNLRTLVQQVLDAGCDDLFTAMAQCFGGEPALELKDLDVPERTTVHVTSAAHSTTIAWSLPTSCPYLDAILQDLVDDSSYVDAMLNGCVEYRNQLDSLASVWPAADTCLDSGSIIWKKDWFTSYGDHAEIKGYPHGKFQFLFEDGGGSPTLGNIVVWEHFPPDYWCRRTCYMSTIPGCLYYSPGDEFRVFDIGPYSTTRKFKLVGWSTGTFSVTSSAMEKHWQHWKIGDGAAGTFDDQRYAGFVLGWKDYRGDEFGDIVASNHTASFVSDLDFSLSESPRVLGPLGVENFSASFQIPLYNIYWINVELILDVAAVTIPGDLIITLPGSEKTETVIHIDSVRRYVVPIGKVPNEEVHVISFDASQTVFEVDAWGLNSLVWPGAFVFGDADASGGVDIDDVVFLINYIFSDGPVPDPIESGDADCSGGASSIDIDDVVHLIDFIFMGGLPPCAECM